MTTLAEIAPTPGDRVFIAGQTGSGKTTLARKLLDARPYIVVVDAKGTLAWPGYKLLFTVDDAIRAGRNVEEHPRLIVRPSYKAMTDPTEMDKLFRWVYLRGHTTLYIDETYGVTYGNTFLEHYGACLTRGREKGIEVWSGTQRPMDIPQIAISESEHAYVFFQKMPQDRLKIEQTTGIPRDAIAALPKRQFLYAPQAGAVRGPLTLNLPSG